MTDKALTAYSISHLVWCNFKYHHALFLMQNKISSSDSVNFEMLYVVFPLMQVWWVSNIHNELILHHISLFVYFQILHM